MDIVLTRQQQPRDAVKADAPTYDELVAFARFTQKFWRHGIEIMRRENIVIDSDEPIQKLAFTFYTNLCEIDSEARHLFHESYGEENYKDERLPDGETYSPEHDATIRAEAKREERERVLHDLGAKCDLAITVKKQSPRTGAYHAAYRQVLKWIRDMRGESLLMGEP